MELGSERDLLLKLITLLLLLVLKKVENRPTFGLNTGFIKKSNKSSVISFSNYSRSLPNSADIQTQQQKYRQQ